MRATPSKPQARPSFPPWRRALDALLPPTQRAGAEVALEAEWDVDRPGRYCPRCGVTAGPGAITWSGCPRCRDRRVTWAGVWRLGGYRPPLSRWIVELKFHRAWAWGDWFGEQLARVTPVAEEATVVVPVPLHWRRRLQRGYDQADLVARAFARHKGLEAAGLLRRIRPTRPQTRLESTAQRRRNVRRAFHLRPVDLRGWTVWLLDDVLTTGATLHHAARLLRRAGAHQVRVAVVAVTDPERIEQGTV